jgi:hypothetical protein
MSLAIQAIIDVMRLRGLSDADILAVVEAAIGEEKRSPGAIRQARYRERKMARDVTSDVTNDVTSDVTEGAKPIDTISNNYLSSSKEKPPKGGKKKGSVTPRKTQLEEDDFPDDRDEGVATRAGMSAKTIDLEWQRFRAHHMAKGSLMANWNQAWVTWVTNWKTFGSKQAQSGSTNGTSGSNWSNRNRDYGNEKNREIYQRH